MILDRIVLHNVGTFAGRQVIDLTPPSAARPIILIGGLNGAGKTTILEALHVALFGALAQPTGRRTGSYDDYLRELRHRDAAQDEKFAIELTFRAYQEGTEHTYWLHRSWLDTGRKIREVLLVSIDGTHSDALTSTWSEQVETFVPRGIAGLFFFDGEQVEALADLERSRQVLASALASLLGLDVLDRLGTDLTVLKRRRRSGPLPADLRETIQERQSAVAELREQEELTRQLLAQHRTQVELAEKALHEATERYRAAGGELGERRERAEAEVSRLRAELTTCEDELRHEAIEPAALLLVPRLLRSAAERAALESRAVRERIVADVFVERDRWLLGQLGATGLHTEDLNTIARLLIADRDRRLSTGEVDEVVGAHGESALRQAVGTTLPSVRRRLRTLVERRADLRLRLDQSERFLAAIPDAESIAPHQAARETAFRTLVGAEAAFRHASEKLENLEAERARADARYETALDRAAEASLTADDEHRLADHIERVRVTLDRLKTEAARRHVDRIAALVLESLGLLLRKDRLITDLRIDPGTFAVTLAGVDGKALSTRQLSAGERQMLAVALLWGLARASGQPLPVVIDTPLGRLDGSHRQNLLERYFPYASHQVILLCTDKEIDDEAYQILGEHIGREYVLEFSPSSNATHVRRDLFWE